MNDWLWENPPVAVRRKEIKSQYSLPKKGVHLRPPIPVLIGNEPLFGILKLPRTLKSLGLLDNCLTAWQSHKARQEAVVFIDARSFEPEHLCRRSSGRVVFLFV